MLRHVVPFANMWMTLRGERASAPIRSFMRFLEDRLGFEAIYDADRLPFGRADLADLFELAERLRISGIIRSYQPVPGMEDEPQWKQWRVRYRDGEESIAAGGSLDDARAALTAALAEGVERYLWFTSTDYFKRPRIATAEKIGSAALIPERFTGFSAEQRKAHPHLILEGREFLWIRGYSWTAKRNVYLPAQAVSAADEVRSRIWTRIEPQILHSSTTGLATWPTRVGAIVRGALEVIERDAYMITWLNQLSGHRIDPKMLFEERPSFKRLAEKCAQYRLRPHLIHMPTDAPAHAILCVVEDETEHAPRFALGLKARRSAAEAAEGALFEALRGRRGARNQLSRGIEAKSTHLVGHYDRLAYWAQKERSARLQFLIEGPLKEQPHEPWEHDSDEKYLARLIAWCAERKYTLASISLTSSAANLTPWHIEFTLIPEMQPIHYTESMPHQSGKRLTEIPHLFGFRPRALPFTDEPHPFA